MRLLLLSPYNGRSSHAAWARGYQRHSEHRIEIAGLSDRAWRWRLNGGSVPLSETLSSLDPPQAILATSMTCLSSLFGMLRRHPLAGLPTVLYMHENQLAYPIRQGGRLEPQLVLRQFHAQLCADFIWFNSDYNRRSWFRRLPKFLARFPDHQGLHLMDRLKEKSTVHPVGLELPRQRPGITLPERPLLLWNQRWEWEKGIDRFAGFVKKFGPDAQFDVVLLGKETMVDEPTRLDLREFLGSRLLFEGWCEREEYLGWLDRATFTVSTARHEFFGISLLEAAAHGVMLFLPDKLSYPELLPSELSQKCSYRSAKQLYRMVKAFLGNPAEYGEVRSGVQEAAYRFDWRRVAPGYDRALEEITK